VVRYLNVSLLYQFELNSKLFGFMLLFYQIYKNTKALQQNLYIS
jgi:hypothetical protein